MSRGRRWGAVGHTPAPCTRRAEGHRSEVYARLRLESGWGDGPTVTRPGTSFALNTLPRGPAVPFQVRDPMLPRLGSPFRDGVSSHSRGALDPRPDVTPPTIQYTSLNPAILINISVGP